MLVSALVRPWHTTLPVHTAGSQASAEVSCLMDGWMESVNGGHNRRIYSYLKIIVTKEGILLPVVFVQVLGYSTRIVLIQNPAINSHAREKNKQFRNSSCFIAFTKRNCIKFRRT